MSKSMLLTLSAQMLLAVGCATFAQGKVVTYPAPAGMADASEYKVTVNEKPVDVYPCNVQFWEGKYYFGSFDFEGEITVTVTSSKPLDKVEIQPARFGIKPTKVSADTISFKTDKPFRISIERDGRVKPLLLFGNPLEKDVPKEGDANVLYFGPGLHKVGRLDVKAGQTVYLAGGAVLSGGIEASGDNVTICGRGIVDGSEYPRFKGPCAFPVHTVDGKNIKIEGITIRNAWSWTLVTNNCRNVLIDNVKVVCSNMINDDALDLVNTQDVVVRNCFFRTQDDSIAVKGCLADHRPCENIEIEDCQFWTDVAYGDIDELYIDMPPGTGDVPLTVFQSLPVDGIIVVTSPQELVSLIVEKAVRMAGMMSIPVLAMVENMAYLDCPHCGERIYPYGHGNEEEAKRLGIPYYAAMPIDPKLAKLVDEGRIEDFEGDYLKDLNEYLSKI